METSNDYKKGLAEIVTMLSEENLSLIDFDKLRTELQQLAGHLDKGQIVEDQLQLLCTDYVARISGMLKAVAAVGRNGEERADVVEILDSLQDLDAAGLVETYRRVSVRFRQAFPSSFGLAPGQYSARRISVKEFK